MTEQLTAVIDDLIRERTFSLEGVESIKKLRDRAAALEAELKRAVDTVAAETKRNAELTATNEVLKARDQGMTKRETDVTAREGRITALEKDTAVAQAKADTLNNVFSTIFRNTIVRETANRQVAPGPSGSYPISVPEAMTRETE
jgi:predicted RNase H-like nuclease (RuvC/YqgF family)